MTITLFPDQQEALDKVISRYLAQPIGGRALVVAPTAWGKTIFFSFLIHQLQPEKTLIIAHRDELLEQARNKMLMIDSTAIVGKVGGGTWDYGAPITVASIDTISGARHLARLEDYELVIVDECHHAPANKYQKVLKHLKKSFQVGVTATPERLDGAPLDEIFGGKPIFKMTIIDAIKRGRLANARAIAIRTETTLDEVGTRKNKDGETDFNEVQLAMVVNTPKRNKRIVDAYREHMDGKLAIVFCVSIAHATAVAAAFNEEGITAKCVTGDTPSDERKRIYDAFDQREIQVLTNVLVLTEGFDCPKIECVIMARPTKSRSLYIQCIGRGARLSPGKEGFTILDLTDNCIKHKLGVLHLQTAIGLHIQDGESVLEAVEREESERRAQVRKLTQKRLKDVHIDLFQQLTWQETETGGFVLEVGEAKHRIAILPSSRTPDHYFLAGRLAPDFTKQRWSSDMPLADAEALAHIKIRALSDNGRRFIDKSAPWNSDLATEKQLSLLRWYRLPIPEGLTKGKANDLLDQHQAKIAMRKVKKDISAIAAI